MTDEVWIAPNIKGWKKLEGKSPTGYEFNASGVYLLFPGLKFGPLSGSEEVTKR